MSSNNAKRLAMLGLSITLIIVAFVYYWITTTTNNPLPGDNFIDQFPSSVEDSINPNINNLNLDLITRDSLELEPEPEPETDSVPPEFDFSFAPTPAASNEWRDEITEFNSGSFLVNNSSDEINQIVQQNNGGGQVYNQEAQDISFAKAVSDYESANQAIADGLAQERKRITDVLARQTTEILDQQGATSPAVNTLSSVSSALLSSKNCGVVPSNDFDTDFEFVTSQIKNSTYSCMGEAIVQGCQSVTVENESGFEYITQIEGIGCSYGIAFKQVPASVDFVYFCPFDLNEDVLTYAKDLDVSTDDTSIVEALLKALRNKTTDGLITDTNLLTGVEADNGQGFVNLSTRLEKETYALIALKVEPDATQCQRFAR